MEVNAESLLKATKTSIRSTLLSHKGSITSSELNSDYIDFLGESIPYTKFKFQDLDSFLLSMPDVCEAQWCGDRLLVRGLAGEKSSHIKDMVSKQKTSCGGGGGKKKNKKSSYSSGGNNFRPGYRTYSNYAFGLSEEDSEWEGDYGSKNKNTNSSSRNIIIDKAIPAGFEDDSEEDDEYYEAFKPVYPSKVTEDPVDKLSRTKEADNNVSDNTCSVVPSPSTQLSKSIHPSRKHANHIRPFNKHQGFLPYPKNLTNIVFQVNQVVTPSQFSIQLLEHADKYNEMQNEMNAVYSKEDLVDVPNEDLLQGSIVAVHHQKCWYRGEIVKFLPVHFVVCLNLVDVGKNVLVNNRDEVQPLRSDFGKLPVQTVMARLFGIKPVIGSFWSHSSIDWLKNKITGKVCEGLVRKIDDKQKSKPVLEIEIYSSTEEKDMNLNDLMMLLKLAKI